MTTSRTLLSRRHLLTASAALGTALAMPRLARAQAGFPTHAVRMIVPAAAGAGQDILGRIVAQGLSELWGQGVVAENRVGAGGTIGTDFIAKAAPDGYILGVVNSSSMAISPAMMPNVPYDAATSFTPLGLGCSNDCALVVRADSPFQSVADVTKAAKAAPGHLTWASGGTGSSTHMAGELYAMSADVELIHVPYRGSPPAVTALLAGEVNMVFLTINSVLPSIAAGQLRALASTGRTADPLLPGVPSFAEAGYPAYEASGWLGFAGPAGMSPDLVARISGDIQKVTTSDSFKQYILRSGMRPMTSTSEEFRAFMKTEIPKWREIVVKSGAKLD